MPCKGNSFWLLNWWKLLACHRAPEDTASGPAAPDMPVTNYASSVLCSGHVGRQRQ